MERFCFAQEDDGFRVEAEMLLNGKDGLIWIYGGDMPHIGAVSVCAQDIAPQEVVFAGHREDGIVRFFREALMEKRLLRHCVVCCGIHYDKIDKRGIDKVVALCRCLCERICQALEARR